MFVVLMVHLFGVAHACDKDSVWDDPAPTAQEERARVRRLQASAQKAIDDYADDSSVSNDQFMEMVNEYVAAIKHAQSDAAAAEQREKQTK